MTDVVGMIHTLALLSSLAVSGAAEPSDARHRWPRWPTEVTHAAAPLRAREDQDHTRVEALLELDAYATPIIEPWLVHALGDPSTAVKREALRICFERELEACVPSALALWSAASEPSLRVAALRVMALAPEGAGFDALLGALRDDNDGLRGQAAQILGWARLRGERRERAIGALLAKLGDLSATVRLYAVESLGLLAADDATLPLARLLDDAEPSVRMAAARALGQIGDPRVAGALGRAVAAVNEPPVTRALMAALCQLRTADRGDDEVELDKELVAALDEPPAGLTSNDVAELLGLRADPSASLVAMVAARLRDPSLARPALAVLVAWGPAATAALREARAAGLSPDLELEIDRQLAALAVPVHTGRDAPAPDDAPRLHVDARSLDALVRLPDVDALAHLGRVAHGIDAAAIRARLGLDEPLVDRRVELALAVLRGPALALGRDDHRVVARIVGWARDHAAPRSDRCLAAWALRAVDRGGAAIEYARRETAALLADRDPAVRACAAASWRALVQRADDRALVDPDARVRVAAILAASAAGPNRLERRRIAWLAAADPDTRVRQAARHARRRRGRGQGIAWVHRVAEVEAPEGRSPWIAVTVDGGSPLSLPAVRIGGQLFAAAPGLGPVRLAE